MIVQSSIVNPYHRCRSEITSCVSVEVIFPSNWINAALGRNFVCVDEEVARRTERLWRFFFSFFSWDQRLLQFFYVWDIFMDILNFRFFTWAHQIFTHACSLWSFLDTPMTRISIVVFCCYCNLLSIFWTVLSWCSHMLTFELPYRKWKSSWNSSQSSRNSTIVRNSQLRNIKSFVTKNIFISIDFEFHSDGLSSHDSKYELTFFSLAR